MAFSMKSLIPVPFGVVFPQKLFEVGRELEMSEDNLRPGRESQCLFCPWAIREQRVEVFCGEKRAFLNGSHPILLETSSL